MSADEPNLFDAASNAPEPSAAAGAGDARDADAPSPMSSAAPGASFSRKRGDRAATSRWMRRRPAETTPRRSLWVGRVSVTLLTLVMFALLGRVAYLQQRPDDRVTALLKAHVSEHEILARRGAIVDRAAASLPPRASAGVSLSIRT